MSLSSVIQTRTFCLWDKSPILSRLSSFDDGDDPMLEQHNHSPYKRLNVLLNSVKAPYNFVRSAQNLDGIESQEYDVLEKQGNKNGSRNILQGPGTIRPLRRETLSSLESAKHRATSLLVTLGLTMCQLLVGTTYIDVQIVNFSPGVSSNHRHCLWFKRCPVFYWSA